MSDPTKEDRLALLWALAVLFPAEARNIFAEPFREGKINIQEIAKLTVIPPRYIPFLMSKVYEDLINAILK